jgi:hypothetical protein
METAELRVILNRILRLYNAEDIMSIQLIHDLTELLDDSIDITECDTDDTQIKRFIQDINTKRLQLIADLNKDTEEEEIEDEVEPVVERCVEAVHEPDLITFDDVQPKQETIEELLEYSSASDKDLDDLITIAPTQNVEETPGIKQSEQLLKASHSSTSSAFSSRSSSPHGQLRVKHVEEHPPLGGYRMRWHMCEYVPGDADATNSSPKQLITKQKFDEYKRDEPDAVIKHVQTLLLQRFLVQDT